MLINPKKKFIRITTNSSYVLDGVEYTRNAYFEIPDEGVEITGDFDLQHTNIKEYGPELIDINNNSEYAISEPMLIDYTDIPISAGAIINIDIKPNLGYMLLLKNISLSIYPPSTATSGTHSLFFLIKNTVNDEFYQLCKIESQYNTNIKLSEGELINGSYGYSNDTDYLNNVIRGVKINNDVNLIVRYLNNTDADKSADREFIIKMLTEKRRFKS